jgi:hypothetical protein
MVSFIVARFVTTPAFISHLRLKLAGVFGFYIKFDFTRSMYSLGGIEYFLTEKDFSLQDLCQPFS